MNCSEFRDKLNHSCYQRINCFYHSWFLRRPTQNDFCDSLANIGLGWTSETKEEPSTSLGSFWAESSFVINIRLSEDHSAGSKIEVDVKLNDDLVLATLATASDFELLRQLFVPLSQKKRCDESLIAKILRHFAPCCWFLMNVREISSGSFLKVENQKHQNMIRITFFLLFSR